MRASPQAVQWTAMSSREPTKFALSDADGDHYVKLAYQCIDTGVHCTPGGLECCDDFDECKADPGSSSTYCH
jgi:hypothetical protein